MISVISLSFELLKECLDFKFNVLVKKETTLMQVHIPGLGLRLGMLLS